jgi:hypothetical protein
MKYKSILIALLVFPFSVAIMSCGNNSFDELKQNLGVSIPSDTKIDGQDFEKEIILIFSEKGLSKLKSEIESSKYFNLQQEFYGSNEMEWQKSDTTLYWDVRNYLEKHLLTGYWIKQDEFTYRFYEPDLSDIPNSAILFHEGYVIEATLRLNDRKMSYKYIKL